MCDKWVRSWPLISEQTSSGIVHHYLLLCPRYLPEKVGINKKKGVNKKWYSHKKKRRENKTVKEWSNTN